MFLGVFVRYDGPVVVGHLGYSKKRSKASKFIMVPVEEHMPLEPKSTCGMSPVTRLYPTFGTWRSAAVREQRTGSLMRRIASNARHTCANILATRIQLDISHLTYRVKVAWC